MVLLYAPGFTDAPGGTPGGGGTSTPGAPVPTGPTWTNNQHTWVGWDGAEWDLSHGLSGLSLQAGARGMLEPPIVRYATKPGAIHGSLHRGSIYDERDCFWPLKVFNGDGSVKWLEHNRRFWRTMDKDLPGQWVITQPSGERRSLTVRFNGLSEDSLTDDLGLVSRQLFGINLVAENPFWMGEPTAQTFTAGTGQNFYGGTSGGGFGPPYYLSTGVTLASASISNPGDVDVWPVWTVRGPSTNAVLNGVGFPMDLLAGEWVRINTDPTDQVARDNYGADRTAELLNFDRFAEIPRGGTVSLEITMTGTGSVSVEITPAYRWAA